MPSKCLLESKYYEYMLSICHISRNIQSMLKQMCTIRHSTNKTGNTACVSKEGAILQLLTSEMPVHLQFSAGSSKEGGRKKNGETPMNRTKPTEIFGLMKVGLTVVARRMASKVCLMSE